WDWFIDLGIDPANLRKFDVPADERAHYSDATIDLEYDFGFTGAKGSGSSGPPARDGRRPRPAARHGRERACEDAP
ncbi:hypothetical protein D8M33_11575, partial [Micrococcus sp. HSID17245]